MTLSALEEARAAFDLIRVDLPPSEQRSAEYLAINPKGKVPALRAGEHVITETRAVLAYLDQLYPQARLVRRTQEPSAAALVLANLVWCSAFLHPLVRQVRAPGRYSTGRVDGVVADGLTKLPHECARLAERVEHGWWYGNASSIVDTYLHWAYSTADASEFPLAECPAVDRHGERVRARASFQRALTHETVASGALEE